MEEIGPVDYAVIAFPGNQFRGEIAPALSELVDAGRIITRNAPAPGHVT